jgi:hypothetical protein
MLRSDAEAGLVAGFLLQSHVRIHAGVLSLRCHE